MSKISMQSAFTAMTLAMLAGSAFAAEPLTATNGMTLYVFDQDKDGQSSCYDQCAMNWPPYLAESGAKAEEGWTQVKRKDGKMQWVYDGHPLYLFKGDSQKGDMKGDGMGGKWHVAKG